jgi:hypothetical protein
VITEPRLEERNAAALSFSRKVEAQMPDAEFLLKQAEQCRRLAASQTDPRLAGELLKMAAERS